MSTNMQSLSGNSLATSNGFVLASPPSGIHNRIEPFVDVVGNPELRKGASAARPTSIAPIGFDQVYEGHVVIDDHDHPDPISFEQAEQATGTNPPPYVETSHSPPPQPRVDELGHRRLRGEMGSWDTFVSGDMRGGGSGSSLAQMGIARINRSENGSTSNRAESFSEPAL
jgi:hypothetical protein